MGSLILEAAARCLQLISANELRDPDPNGFLYLCVYLFIHVSPHFPFLPAVLLSLFHCLFLSLCSSRTVSSLLSLQAKSHASPAQTPPPDPAQEGSASTAVTPHRVVEVAIPHVGTFVIQSREGGYDDEVAPVPAGVLFVCDVGFSRAV